MHTPPLVPGNETTVHLVLNDFGELGCAYVEADPSRSDKWTIVSNIAKGEYSKPLKVIALNLDEGWCRDVTQYIAQDVFDLGRRENSFSPPARDFVERILGIAIFAR
jgi:hypothetical protein